MAITIQAGGHGTIVLIDLSYFVFYRYFATFNWYKRQSSSGSGVDVENIIQDTVFMDKYSKMFEKTINEIVKMYKVVEKSNVVFVKDCCRDNIWRHQHYNGYKATRDDKSTTFNKDVFVYTYNVLLPQLKEKIGFQMIGHYCLEADDVIAIITNSLLDYSMESGVETHLVVVTNDNDYIQLMNHRHLSGGTGNGHLMIRNLQDKNICERVGCPPDEYIRVKKVIGDKSDNIPSIVKKCGEKTAYKLATNESALLALFEKDKSAKEQYELNELLIDFSKIPPEYTQEVKEKIIII
jgi:5'-3' exonuclease